MATDAAASSGGELTRKRSLTPTGVTASRMALTAPDTLLRTTVQVGEGGLVP
jgi:hypothetical protein